MGDKVRTGLGEMWERMAGWQKMAAGLAVALLAVFTAGMSAQARIAEARDIPPRLQVLEDWREDVDLALLFLVCSRVAENEGRDPRPCDAVLKDMEDMLPLGVR